ncbi:anti-ECFsigma factor, ChrR [Luminiphilus syltensis NOR5-1B]|uniref:Anti-ECFsigma factor, ChrR n=1 Tax=Luminiphilus syltensis NOR5-1B TaxID=565045 RepID=B8KTN9_9GAMM|nr:cupin domain-containing protein [Luminiphilus syltensis]EED35827.1 anti-ECFsigma factor, ChrR [Luminiphilus syltensis NOR5-1B]
MSTELQLNTRLDKALRIDTAAMEWEASPASGVWRKRLYRAGPQESGRVTSVVRYDPGARFHSHPHPEGEEILVLEGVFSDERGDWTKGSFLLNPEGFEHAPFSEGGCELLVRLRQYPGESRLQCGITPEDYRWQGSPGDVQTMPLYHQEPYRDTQRLEHWPEGWRGSLVFADGAEVFVIEGAIAVDGTELRDRGWLRLPPGRYPATALNSAQLYIKEGGRLYL